MKRFLIVLTVIATVFCLGLTLMACGSSDNGNPGDGFDGYVEPEVLEYVLLDDGTYGVKAASRESERLEELVIPDVYEGIAVTRIVDEAFQLSYTLRSITLPNSITHIGDHAFEGCHNLQSIELPDSVTYIGVRAFDACVALTTIHIPNGFTEISEEAFYCCRGLTEVTLPDTLQTLGKRAFGECNSLTSITLPDVMTEIADGAFSGCTSLTEIVIKDTVTTIGANAFMDCTGATSLTIGSGVTTIGNHAFAYCESLASLVIPDTVTTIGDYAFQNCESVVTLDLGKKDKELGNYVFSGCSGLQEVKGAAKTAGKVCSNSYAEDVALYVSAPTYVILSESIWGDGVTKVYVEDGVQGIANDAMHNCSDLEYVYIPASVTHFGWSIFGGCYNLTTIEFEGTKAQWENIQKNYSWDYACGDFTIVCSNGNIAKDLHKYE